MTTAALDELFLLLLFVGGALTVLVPAAIVADWLEVRRKRMGRLSQYRRQSARRRRP